MLTIITPVFNGEEYLHEVIESIVSQTEIELKLVIVNDGSTDSSLRIAEEWASRYPQLIQIIDQPNAGEAAAVNNGMKLVLTKYVGIVNADDPLLSGHCRKMIDSLEGNPQVVVAYPDWLMIDSRGKTIREVVTLNYTKRALVADLVCIPGPGAIIRVEAIKDFPAREKQFKYISDYVLWLRMANVGDFIRVPETLATWRQHALGTTATADTGAVASEIRQLVSNKFYDFCGSTVSQTWLRSARAHAHYYSALGALANKKIPGRRLLIKSFLIKPLPNIGYQTHHRSLLATGAIFMGALGRKAQEVRKKKLGLS